MVLIRTLLVLFVIAAGAQAAAAAEAWRVVASTGAVATGAPGVMPIAVNNEQSLPGDSWVETGASGRVVLTRGQESVAIGPNSRVMLPSAPVNGNTQVLQTVGSALYQIGKQKAPHFQVDTPYLAAVVKGTTFTVSVTEGVASVDVSEGLIQVATPDGADAKDVAPGFTGFVAHRQRDTVIVVPTSAAPGLDELKATKPEPKGGLKQSSNELPRVVITAPIGDLSLDVKTASGGLVTGTEVAGVPTTKNATATAAATGESSDVSLSAGSESAGARADVSVESGGVGASADVGGGAAGVGVGAGNGGVSADVSTGGAGAGVGVDVGGGNGVGVGVGIGGDSGGGAGVGVSLGNGGVGLDVSLGAGGSGGGLGLGLGLGKSGS